jgi:hypothetical protein
MTRERRRLVRCLCRSVGTSVRITWYTWLGLVCYYLHHYTINFCQYFALMRNLFGIERGSPTCSIKYLQYCRYLGTYPTGDIIVQDSEASCEQVRLNGNIPRSTCRSRIIPAFFLQSRRPGSAIWNQNPPATEINGRRRRRNGLW